MYSRLVNLFQPSMIDAKRWLEGSLNGAPMLLLMSQSLMITFGSGTETLGGGCE